MGRQERLATFYELKNAIAVVLGRIELAQLARDEETHERHLLRADQAGYRVRAALLRHELALRDDEWTPPGPEDT